MNQISIEEARRWSAELTKEELAAAKQVAHARNISQRRGGKADGLCDQTRSSIAIDEEGAIAEIGAAKALGLNWTGAFKDFDTWLRWRDVDSDVCDYEIKSSRYGSARLLLRPQNSPDRVYVLAIVSVPAVRLVGWAYGHDVKTDANWDESMPRPCFALGQSRLNPMETLPGLHATDAARIP